MDLYIFDLYMLNDLSIRCLLYILGDSLVGFQSFQVNKNMMVDHLQLCIESLAHMEMVGMDLSLVLAMVVQLSQNIL